MKLYKFTICLVFLMISNCVSAIEYYKISYSPLSINLGLSEDTAELAIVVNLSQSSDSMFLFIPKTFDYLMAYSNKEKHSTILGQKTTISDNQTDPFLIFPINNIDTIYLKILNNESLTIPILIKNQNEVNKHLFIRNILSSIFIGILGSLFLYNLIIYFFLRDSTYLFYVMYLLCISLAQLSLIGFDFYLFNGNSQVYNISLHVFSGLSGLFGIWFAQKFLKTKQDFKKIHVVLNLIVIIYALVLVFLVLGFEMLSYKLIQLGGLSIPLIVVFSIYIAIKGNKSGLFIAISWSILVIGAIFLTLKDFGIVPINLITNYTMALGVALEAILLSVALASRINLLNKEKNDANQRVFQEVKKNEELVRTQNVILEDKVKQRTSELEQALENLKSTQSQLVQSEKMASLGVLTAGIAHEINNPINFVTANIIPLRENIESITNLLIAYKNIDYDNPAPSLQKVEKLEEEIELEYIKDETKQLLNGIEEGAKRTHSIVDGLKTFSHGDSDLSAVSDINKGIESTLSVLKSKLKHVTLLTQYDENLPKITCQIGKLNQVFLNLINNALDALEEKYGQDDASKAQLNITTGIKNNRIIITVGDNAKGIPDNIQQKVFEPFFTTKQVGKGTGLGMSISYSIIEEHEGELTFDSTEGKGTVFTVSLPMD